jgi:hypothetical protein
MRLGLIADIHEHVEFLRIALTQFRKEKVDRVIVLGDVYRTGERLDETCRLLAESGATGVWGNHDFGLCLNPTESAQAVFLPSTLEFMASLAARVEHSDYYIAHVEPGLDPDCIADLWFYGGPPCDDERRARIFGTVDNRLMFVGHYHNWLHVTPAGVDDWAGDTTLGLSEGRHLVVVGALVQGRYAVYDLETSEFVPFDCENRDSSDVVGVDSIQTPRGDQVPTIGRNDPRI